MAAGTDAADPPPFSVAIGRKRRGPILVKHGAEDVAGTLYRQAPFDLLEQVKHVPCIALQRFLVFRAALKIDGGFRLPCSESLRLLRLALLLEILPNRPHLLCHPAGLLAKLPRPGGEFVGGVPQFPQLVSQVCPAAWP